MDADLQKVYDIVTMARRPEEVFKPMNVVLPPRLLEQHLKPQVEEMYTVLDQEKYSNTEDRDAAETARGKLDAFFAEALSKSSKGLYALDDFTPQARMPNGPMVVVSGVEYCVGEKFHIGTHSSLYYGRMKVDDGHARVVFRLSHTEEDNSYITQEIRMLNLLHKQDVGYWRNIPFLYDRFQTGERIGTILRYFPGLNLTSLREKSFHKSGLDQRHMIWILDRSLGLMFYYHSLGILHGNIHPDRIRICPGNHNVMFTGWGGAVYRPAASGEKIEINKSPFEAPEVSEGGGIGPWTDIYSLGKTMIWLLGGNPVTNEMPESVHEKIQNFLRNMVWLNPQMRPSSAQDLYEAQNKLKDSLWERRFLHLNI